MVSFTHPVAVAACNVGSRKQSESISRKSQLAWVLPDDEDEMQIKLQSVQLPAITFNPRRGCLALFVHANHNAWDPR